MGCMQSRILPGPESGNEKAPFEKNPNVLSGDVTKKKEAKYEREMKLRERQLNRTVAAEKFSAKIMDDTERLSLGTRSRGTSRATSRANSPTPNGRKQVHFKTDEVKTFKSADSSKPSSDNSVISNGKNVKTEENNQKNDLSAVIVNVAPAAGKETSPIKSQDANHKNQSNSLLLTDKIGPQNGQVISIKENIMETQAGSGGEKLATIEERASSRCSSKSEKEVKRG